MDRAKIAEALRTNNIIGVLKVIEAEYELAIKGYTSSLIEAEPEKVQVIQGRIRGLQEAQKTLKGFYQTQEALNG